MPPDQKKPVSGSPRAERSEREELLFLIDRKPEPAELAIRAVCGAVAGAIVAVGALFSRLLRDIAPEGWRFWLVVALVAAAFAYFAATRGDRFWGAED